MADAPDTLKPPPDQQGQLNLPSWAPLAMMILGSGLGGLKYGNRDRSWNFGAPFKALGDYGGFAAQTSMQEQARKQQADENLKRQRGEEERLRGPLREFFKPKDVPEGMQGPPGPSQAQATGIPEELKGLVDVVSPTAMGEALAGSALKKPELDVKHEQASALLDFKREQAKAVDEIKVEQNKIRQENSDLRREIAIAKDDREREKLTEQKRVNDEKLKELQAKEAELKASAGLKGKQGKKIEEETKEMPDKTAAKSEEERAAASLRRAQEERTRAPEQGVTPLGKPFEKKGALPKPGGPSATTPTPGQAGPPAPVVPKGRAKSITLSHLKDGTLTEQDVLLDMKRNKYPKEQVDEIQEALKEWRMNP